MEPALTVTTLIAWTPFLAVGFLRNLLISGLAMALGTIIGIALARLRYGDLRGGRVVAGAFTSVCRNVPSFVLIFYVAFLLPVELTWGQWVIQVPVWIKAALALTLPVVGFASDQFRGFLRQRAAKLAGAAPMFWTAWAQYFLIILMASATASVIGADEVVGRANRVVATNNDPTLLIATYSYVTAWFLLTGLAISRAAPRLARTVQARA